MRQINAYSLVVGQHPCPEKPIRHGMAWRYPWAAMEPGAVIAVMDTSRAARASLSAAASAAGKRLGRRYATGKLMDEDCLKPVHIGYWCCRIDGCEIKPPSDDTLADRFKGDEWHARRKARLTRSLDKVKRPPTIQPVGSIEDVRARIDGEVGYVEAPEVTEARVAEWADAPGFDAGEDAI